MVRVPEELPAADHLDLLAAPTAAALRGWAGLYRVSVITIDPRLADTATLVAELGADPADMANCVVVGGRRAGEERVAACLVLSTTRADVNGVVRSLLDVRKASFLGTDDAVERTGMEYGGITPLGLPDAWPVLVDSAVLQRERVMIGAGVRSAKLWLPGALCADLPGARVVDGLAR